MKKSISSLAILGLILILTPGCGNDTGTAWVGCVLKSLFATADNYQRVFGQDSIALTAAGDTSGNLFVAGKGSDGGGIAHWTIRKSVDSGVTWTMADDFQYASGHDSTAYGVGSDQSGNIFAVGNGNTAAGIGHWLVRKSKDAGLTWTTVDDFISTAGQPSQAGGFVRDSLGNLYVVGNAAGGGGDTSWVVRKSVNGGTTWSTVDSFQETAGVNSSALAIREDSAGNLFAVGFGTDGGALDHWVVRKSTNHGTSWTTVENYQQTTSQSAQAQGITVDTDGHIWVAGYGSDGAAFHWIVRTTTNAGSNWKTIDDFQFASGLDAQAVGIGLDAFGNIDVAGFYTDAGAKSHGIVRQSVNTGSTWKTIENFQLVSGQSTQYDSVLSHSNGNVMITGAATDAAGHTHFLTRSLGCN